MLNELIAFHYNYDPTQSAEFLWGYASECINDDDSSSIVINTRYSPVEDVQGKFWLYSINVPIKWSRQSKRTKCYLIKWCTSSWKVHQVQPTYGELACAMAIK